MMQAYYGGSGRAHLSTLRDFYAIKTTVRIPGAYVPLVTLEPHQRAVITEPVDQATYDEYMRVTEPLCAEHKEIVERIVYDWRWPTADEERRLREIQVALDTAIATIERRGSTLN